MIDSAHCGVNLELLVELESKVLLNVLASISQRSLVNGCTGVEDFASSSFCREAKGYSGNWIRGSGEPSAKKPTLDELTSGEEAKAT